jgi:hypothetical protein
LRGVRWSISTSAARLDDVAGIGVHGQHFAPPWILPTDSGSMMPDASTVT